MPRAIRKCVALGPIVGRFVPRPSPQPPQVFTPGSLAYFSYPGTSTLFADTGTDWVRLSADWPTIQPDSAAGIETGALAALVGPPNQVARWSFSGFRQGQTIYGHFVPQTGSSVTHRFGRSDGPCDIVTARARRLPLPPARQRGQWSLQLDTQKNYSAKTTPRITAKLSGF